MGEARIKDLNARETAFAKTKKCIFCGGAILATTVDHYPPRGIFSDKQWPEGYVFPACSPCNSGSKDAENWIAWLSRMHLGDASESTGLTAAMKAIIDSLRRKHPAAFKYMQLSANEKRRSAKSMNWPIAPGSTYSQLPLIRVPYEVQDAVQVFGEKLAKALHFEVTKKIVPNNAGIRVLWFTNAQQLSGKVPDDIFSKLTNSAKLFRGKKDLSAQFNYKFSISDDGAVGMYTAWFRFSFCVHIWLAFDATMLERTIREAEAQADLDRAKEESPKSVHP